MKKVRLDIEQLVVESFVTADDELASSGTVVAHQSFPGRDYTCGGGGSYTNDPCYCAGNPTALGSSAACDTMDPRALSCASLAYCPTGVSEGCQPTAYFC
jgi:hypothetical protein